MPHRSLFVDRVLVIAWQMPEEADLAAIGEKLAQRHAELGRPLLYLSVIGARAIPSPAVREAMVPFFRQVLTLCESMHVVAEGAEPVPKVKLGFIQDTLGRIGAEQARVYVANSVVDIGAASPEAVRPEIARALRQANAKRLLEFVGP
jgi:hypothetical protein